MNNIYHLLDRNAGVKVDRDCFPEDRKEKNKCFITSTRNRLLTKQLTNMASSLSI